MLLHKGLARVKNSHICLDEITFIIFALRVPAEHQNHFNCSEVVQEPKDLKYDLK